MSATRLVRALGAAGASGALVVGALALGTGAASAATTTAATSYLCSLNGAPAIAIPVRATAPAPLAAKPGTAIPSLPVTAVAKVPSAVADQLAPAFGTGLTAATTFPISIAGASVPFALASQPIDNADQVTTLKVAGDLKNAPFTVPATMKPGYYKVGLPHAFTLTFTSAALGGTVATSACTLAKNANSQLGWFTVLNKNGTAPAKPTAFTTVKLVKSTVKTTQRAVLNVGVKTTAGGGTPTGTVTVLDKGKTVASGKLAGGHVKLTLKKLAKGTHSLAVKYAGGSAYKSLARTVKLVVTKA